MAKHSGGNGGFWKGHNQRDDADDAVETETWNCGQCGMSGTTVMGDGSMALALHVAMAHPVDNS